jgi:hypothetical protein
MYYPLSQITSNLYTNGGEYVYKSNQENYTGYYWKTSSGKIYTGKTPQDIPTSELISANSNPLNPVLQNSSIPVIINQNDFENTNYINVKSIDTSQIALTPIYFPTQPTQQDYQIGEFRRYFCKKTNEIQYIEISKDQFDLLVAKDPQILWQLYFPFFIPWDITGNKEQVARVNKNIVDLTMKNLRLPRFNDYIKNDYTKYYK